LRRFFAPPDRELDLLGVESGDVVVDLGAGVGYFAPAALARIGPSGILYLVDPDGENLERARSRVAGDPRVRYLLSSAGRIAAIPTGSADRALLSLVLCCMVDKAGAMNETWRVLRSGGRAYVSYPRWNLRLRGRRPSLRVRPGEWETLERVHPWRSFPLKNSRLFVRHLLVRP
jgi:SAM-dependent methyltransferase